MPQCTPVCPLAKVLGWIKPALFSPVELSAPEVGSLTTRPEPMHGMAALCALANRSEATLLDWIRTRDFPAVKVDEEWTADRNQVVDWLKNRLNA